MAKYKEKHILKFDLRIFTAIQICLKYVKVPKSLEPNAQMATADRPTTYLNLMAPFSITLQIRETGFKSRAPLFVITPLLNGRLLTVGQP
jgi:hypothetical protein